MKPKQQKLRTETIKVFSRHKTAMYRSLNVAAPQSNGILLDFGYVMSKV